MKQAAVRLVTPYSRNQESEGRDQIVFWLGVLVLLLLPIERMRFTFNLKPSDGALVLLALYGLVRAWKTHQRLDFPLLLPMWVILFSSLVATLVGFAHSNSIIAIVQEIYIFFWFIVLTNVLKALSLSDLDRLMKVWSVIACVEAATTLMGMLRIGPSMFYTGANYDPEVTTGFIRAVGTYENSNAAGVYLSISFFVLLATSWPTWLRLGLGVWLYAGMFGTGSNGAMVSTLVGFLILVVVHAITKSRRENLLWIAVISLATAIGSAASSLIIGLLSSLLPGAGYAARGEMLFNTLGRLSHSLARRLDIMSWAWETYSRHPWGTGPDSFAALAGSLHNDYAAFWFERGPLGLIGWLWLVGATLLTSLYTATRLGDRRQRWQVLMLGAGFLASVINAFSHEVSHMRQLWLLMAFLFALSSACLAQQHTCSISNAGAEGKRNWHGFDQGAPGNETRPAA